MRSRRVVGSGMTVIFMFVFVMQLEVPLQICLRSPSWLPLLQLLLRLILISMNPKAMQH